MFLKDFNEKQKKGFWIIANIMVFADGKIEESEKKLLEDYKVELGQPDLKIEQPKEKVDKVIDSMKLNEKQKKELMFELVGLAYSDNYYDITERHILEDIQRKIKMSDKDVVIIGKFVNSIFDIYSLLGEYING